MDQIIFPTDAACPECGAPRVDGMSCWEQLGCLIAWEYQDLALQAVHFLIVGSYNLQHPAQFTEEALAGFRAVFIDHLDSGLNLKEIRRRVGMAASGATRVRRPEAERRPLLRSWSTTIADVYIPAKPGGAAARVRAWAASIRNELPVTERLSPRPWRSG